MYPHYTLQMLEARARADQLQRAATRAARGTTHRQHPDRRSDGWIPRPLLSRARPPRLRAVD